MYKIIEEKCIGCGACAAICPQGVKMREDFKAEIIDAQELDKCGGETLCPVDAIKKTSEE